MLVCQRCRANFAAGVYALRMSPRPGQEPGSGEIVFKLLCGGCGIGGGAESDRRMYQKRPVTVGSSVTYPMGAAPKVERVELVCTVNKAS